MQRTAEPEGSLAGSASDTSKANLIAAPAADSWLLKIGTRSGGVLLRLARQQDRAENAGPDQAVAPWMTPRHRGSVLLSCRRATDDCCGTANLCQWGLGHSTYFWHWPSGVIES